MFKREYIEFDTTPVNEDCVSVSQTDDYFPAMRAEANRYRDMLEKRFPKIPGDFCVKSCPHDFGTYLEIRYWFDDDNEGWSSCNFVENNLPLTWDDDKVFDWDWVDDDDDDD